MKNGRVSHKLVRNFVGAILVIPNYVVRHLHKSIQLSRLVPFFHDGKQSLFINIMIYIVL